MNEPARRGRPPRQREGEPQAEPNVSKRLQEQRAARLARGDNDKSAMLKLGVDETKLDTDNFVYRFANEGEGNARLHHLTTQKDYEYVSNSDLGEPTDDMGDAVSRVIGQRKDGSAERAVLLRKPKGWYEDDKAKDRKPQEAQMSAIRRGKVQAATGSGYVNPEDIGLTSESGIRITTPRTGGFEP